MNATLSLYRNAVAAAVALLVAGCASTSAPDMNIAGGSGSAVVTSAATQGNVAHVGFLTDYAALQPAPGGSGVLCWRKPDVAWKAYDAVMIERMNVSFARSGNGAMVDPADLKMLVDYFHDALVRDLQPNERIVDKPGPGVLRVRIALTSLVPTNAADSLVGTAVPYGFVAEIGSGAATGRPAGSTPYLGETGMEVQFRDGASGAVVAECADTEIGRKYAASLNGGVTNAAQTWVNGYMDSFTSWSYAQDAFNKWAALLAARLAQLKAG
ncbi:MAG: DUF3313 domain-containing protein [Proteobacteria bacterium]|nr:DUF3313 domain-containing protein [Pseudomonadota bacterium]